MPTIEIEGVGDVELGAEFLKLSPEKQNQTIEEIVMSIKAAQTPGSKQPAPASPSAIPMTAGDVVKGAVENLPSSAGKFAGDIYQAVRHPIDTATAIKNIGLGAIQKGANAVVSPETQLEMGGSFGSEYEPYAEAVGKFFTDRYGGTENIKKTIATDPVGALADVSTVLTGGGAAAARVPGMAGKVGRIAADVGKVVDPVTLAASGIGAGASLGGRAAAGAVGNLGTFTGGQSLRTAAGAGYKGGDAAKVFQDNLRGNVPMESAVTDAKQALANMRVQRRTAYRADMADIARDKTPLDFAPIDNQLRKIAEIGVYKGKTINKSTEGVWRQIADTVDDWRQADPAEFHTPEGLDALKQAIGDIRDSTQYGTPSRVMADRVYNVVKDQIVKQASRYGKAMKEYEEASNLIREMEKTLSLNPKASVDTSLRKLQSIMRNNANTNYGKRLDLAKILTDAGATHLMEKLAG